jgi:DNA polymerase-4
MLAQKIKRAVQEKIGAQMKSSIGLAPNRFLAKVASDFEKPNGLTIFRPQDLPHKLHSLATRDLPGIGEQMESRLQRQGIRTVQQLCQLSREEMRRVWGGVTGERFWAWLRGQEPPLPPSHRHSIGHSHVLPPEQRNPQGLYQIAKRLTHKAAIRLRKENFWTSGLSLAIRFPDEPAWEGRASFSDTQDTPRFLKVLEQLWTGVPPHKPVWIGVTFYPLISADRHSPSLFDNPRQEKLSSVMDAINDKYGNDTAYFASLQDTLRQAPTRIAFSRIPDLKEF